MEKANRRDLRPCGGAALKLLHKDEDDPGFVVISALAAEQH